METTESAALTEEKPVAPEREAEVTEQGAKEATEPEMVDVDIAKIERLCVAEVNAKMQGLQKMFIEIMEGAVKGGEPDSDLLNAFFSTISDLSSTSVEMGKIGTIIRLSMQYPEVAAQYRTMKADPEFASRAETYWTRTEEAAEKLKDAEKARAGSK